MTSIVIITYNRKSLLKNCLNSVLAQKYSGDSEIIVVDNHSGDGTVDFIKDNFKNRVKLVSSGSRTGLAKAKELGINAASGDIIAFTDDDCTVAPDWLAEINISLAKNDFAGGPTLPDNAVFPGWWKKSLNWMIGINPSPDSKFPPLGSNVAFRRQALERIKTNARVKELLPYGEDNDRIQKALTAGFSLAINRNMIVYHHLPAQKFAFSYLLKRSYNEGNCLVNYGNRIKGSAYNLFSLPVNLLRSLFLLDLNRFFRMIVNASYLAHCLSKSSDNER